MKETSVMPVTPRTSRNVVGIAAAAISSGTIARPLAKTRASTTSAPTAPIRVS
ncbi:hypothetical protein SGLAM104S_09756 [Streptomyces glaucescens]